MCMTHSQDAAPITPPGIGALPGAVDPQGNTPPAPMAMDQSPQPAQVKAPTKFGRAVEVASGGAFDPTGGLDQGPGPNGRLTKFGALSKIFSSMMQGGVVGGFLGKSTPGGGFAAANSHFLQQRLMEMQRYQFAANAMKLQSEIQKNQAEAQWAQRRPMVTRTAPAIKGQDDQGNPIFMEQDPQDGQFKPVNGIRPEGQSKVVDTEEGGLVGYDPDNLRAGAIPLTLRGGPTVGSAADATNDVSEGTAESASEPSNRAARSVPPGMFGGQPTLPTQFDSGSPRMSSGGAVSTAPSASPSAISAGAIPRQLHTAGYSTPKPTVRASRNAAGVETDNIIDTNPHSPTFGQRIASTDNTRQPVPDRVGGRDNTRNAQKASDVERSEQYAGAALEKSGGDPDKAIQSLNNLKIADPDAAKDFNRLLPQIRKSITDRAKQRKPKPKANNPFGMNNDDYQRMVGGDQNQSEQEQNEE